MAKITEAEASARRVHEVLINAVTARRNKCLEILKDMTVKAEYMPFGSTKPSLGEILPNGKILYFSFETFVGLNDILKKLGNIDAIQNPMMLWTIEWTASECYQIHKALFAYDCSRLEEVDITRLCDMTEPRHYGQR